MPFNLPTYTAGNVSFGPATVYIGPTGATPSVDIGLISEDGVTIEHSAEKRDINAGNPRVNVLTFTQAQGVRVTWTALEWNFQRFNQALGSGNTTAVAGRETFAFGGDPAVTQVAIRVRHQAAQSGHTFYLNVWKAQSDGGLNVPMGQDEHQFEMAFKAVQSSTNWAGATLNQEEQLVLWERETA